VDEPRTKTDSYRIPVGDHRVEQVIERSRFIATVGHAADPEAARAFIDRIRAEYPDATHNCWAYVAGPAGSTAFCGMSDAGEPHGTAGRPMLDVLVHSDVGEIVAVVTRYYGGVKLGKGGLVRAYSGAVQSALQSVPTSWRIERRTVEVIVGYADVEAVRRTLAEVEAEVLEESYGEAVRYSAAVPVAGVSTLARLLADRTAGRATVNEGDDADASGKAQ
jgi:uncharacterized YigZ family protein